MITFSASARSIIRAVLPTRTPEQKAFEERIAHIDVDAALAKSERQVEEARRPRSGGVASQGNAPTDS